eukprot:scaffold87640_cov35-Tisochrysis_lutea.AAC.3
MEQARAPQPGGKARAQRAHRHASIRKRPKRERAAPIPQRERRRPNAAPGRGSLRREKRWRAQHQSRPHALRAQLLTGRHRAAGRAADRASAGICRALPPHRRAQQPAFPTR